LRGRGGPPRDFWDLGDIFKSYEPMAYHILLASPCMQECNARLSSSHQFESWQDDMWTSHAVSDMNFMRWIFVPSHLATNTWPDLVVPLIFYCSLLFYLLKFILK
jgi:hypothetical protein